MEAIRRASAMNLLRATVLSVLVACSVAVEAREPDAFDSATYEPLFQGLIYDRDVELLLGYVRRSIQAIAEGREPPAPPPEMETRAGELAAQLKARGTLAAFMVLSLLEEQAKGLRRELAPRPHSALPPTVPYTPVGGR
jgi:hypothetical protein